MFITSFLLQLCYNEKRTITKVKTDINVRYAAPERSIKNESELSENETKKTSVTPKTKGRFMRKEMRKTTKTSLKKISRKQIKVNN